MTSLSPQIRQSIWQASMAISNAGISAQMADLDPDNTKKLLTQLEEAHAAINTAILSVRSGLDDETTPSALQMLAQSENAVGETHQQLWYNAHKAEVYAGKAAASVEAMVNTGSLSHYMGMRATVVLRQARRLLRQAIELGGFRPGRGVEHDTEP